MDVSQKTIKERKQAMRSQMKALRTGLSSCYRIEADQKIRFNLKSTEAYKKSQVIFCYVSFAEEADTRLFIQDALEEGKQVAVPKCLGNGRMDAFVISGLSDLEKGFHGILEPGSHCRKIEPDHLDLCVIPCIACTSQGVRLGYGGGYYDRYLIKTSGFRVLLCQEKMVCQDIPVESHDCQMDMIITENQVIFC